MIKKLSADCRLKEAQVRSYLEECFLPKNTSFHVCESVGSTNDYVMSRMDECGAGYLVCVADHQTDGRGRNGRKWQSPAGSNIYMSTGFKFSGCNLSLLSGLSLACGVSIARFIDTLGIHPQLKWPNDILVSGRKLAGILIETRIKAGRVFVVVGLGLNVDMSDCEAQEIDQPWTDLKSSAPHTSGGFDNNWLVSQLISALTSACECYQQTGMELFLQDWSKYDVLQGREIWVHVDEQELLAKVIGINDDCSLSVEVDGQKKNIYAADVKIKLKK